MEELPKAPVGEICLLSSPSIMISFEMEVGRETIPLLVMEASLSGQVKDWSSDVSLNFSGICVFLYSDKWLVFFVFILQRKLTNSRLFSVYFIKLSYISDKVAVKATLSSD